jgi:hypothetical protein
VKRIKSNIAAVLALALFPLIGGSAQTPLFGAPEYLRVTWGVIVENYLDPALASHNVTPSINFNFGAGVSFPFSALPRLAFAPSGDIYYYNTEYSANGQPVPGDEGGFASAFVLGLLLNAPVVYSYPISDTISVSGGLGLAFDLRAAITTDAAKAGNTALINAYLWDQGRFFMPSTALRFEYKLTERVGFGFNGRFFWPIYNWWSGESYGFFDQSKYLIDLVVRYKFDAPAAAAKTESPDLPPPATITAPASAPAPAASTPADQAPTSP